MPVRSIAPSPPESTVLLPPSLSGHCAVLTQHAYDPAAHRPDSPADEIAQARQQVRTDHVTGVLDALIAAHGDSVDLRPYASPERSAATAAAVRNGVGLIVGPLLPPDAATGRSGSPAALLRSVDGGYHPLDAHWHRVTARRRPAGDPRADDSAQPPVRCTDLARPGPAHAAEAPDLVLRLGSREADFLALAQYHRILAAAGWAAPAPWAGVIGTETRAGSPLLAWVDLDHPQIRTFSRRAPDGWRWRSLLERHDHEHAFRVAVAREAAAGGRLVAPVVNRECAACPWWETCRGTLDPDDISLRIEKGALDVREVLTLRRLGVVTLDDLLAADPAWLLPHYLPEVRHRPDAEQRLRTAVRRARMLTSGEVLQRDSTGPIEFPAGATEIDLDIETSADGHVYLWGFMLHRAGTPGRYVEFSRFTDLDDSAELALAGEALGWLKQEVDRGDCRVYHYSGYEVAMIAALAARSDAPVLHWAAEYARSDFVDLLDVVVQHFFGASGLGLKQVARHVGFEWRDEDPGGLNSQHWFADAVHGSPGVRESARQRVLDYNEDDVAATAALRAWLRAQ